MVTCGALQPQTVRRSPTVPESRGTGEKLLTDTFEERIVQTEKITKKMRKARCLDAFVPACSLHNLSRLIDQGKRAQTKQHEANLCCEWLGPSFDLGDNGFWSI